ncbi:MAG: helix-turn-helix domain-containing protein [Candidatus Moraniibacteriota bacterium]
MLDKILEEIGLSENSIRIYMRLLEGSSFSARQLAENLNIPRPSVYDNLKILMNKGLVVEHDKENKKIFTADDVKNLPQLIKSKRETLEEFETEIKKILPLLTKQTKNIEPKIKFYSGAEGIRQVLRDMLWYENIETLTMWPISEMVEVLGKDYLADLNRRRIRRNISIKGIWPEDKAVKLKEHPFLGVGKKHLRELRLAPKNMIWNMSYWLYDDKVAFISSRQEGFGFVIHSKDFSELIRTQFEVIWKISKTIKPQSKYTDKFLETI